MNLLKVLSLSAAIFITNASFSQYDDSEFADTEYEDLYVDQNSDTEALMNEKIRLNGVIGLGLYASQFLSGVEQGGSRLGGKVEFLRIPKHISLDLRLATGEGLSSYGAMLKFFYHWYLDQEVATGISVGFGLGAMYSEGSDDVSNMSSFTPNEAGENGLIDFMAAPYVRYIWDFGNKFGLAADLEFQLVPLRRFVEAPTKNDKNMQTRVVLALNLLFGV